MEIGGGCGDERGQEEVEMRKIRVRRACITVPHGEHISVLKTYAKKAKKKLCE